MANRLFFDLSGRATRGWLGAVALFAAVYVVFTPFPANAAFVFCNQTKSLLEAAFGHRDQSIWISEGWWQIQPGQCARVFGKPLKQRFYFYFARTLASPAAGGRKPKAWAGKYPLCSDGKAFRIVGDENCEDRGYQTSMFQGIDIGSNRKDYTLNFQDDGSVGAASSK